jgi:ATP-binding cassette subfamily B protein
MYKDFEPLMKGYYDALEKVNSAIIEYTQGMAVIKAFNQTVESFRKYKDLIEDYHNYVWEWTKKFLPSWAVFSVVVTANIIVYVSGSLSMPILILFLILGVGFGEPLMKLTIFSSVFSQIVEGERRINEILIEEPLKEPKMENSMTSILLFHKTR